jgi:D-alanine transaminase
MRSATPAWAWFDGAVVPFRDARLPIEDRGIQFSESLYEVVAVVKGQGFRLIDHAGRMLDGARELGIQDGVPAPSAWNGILAALHHREPLSAALLYAQVSGGAAPRRHVPESRPRPIFFAYLREFQFPNPADIARGIAAITVPDSRWQRRDLKTTMLLPAVIAKGEAQRRGADEAILVGQDGYVNEGASSTVFAVIGRSVFTPPTNQRVLDGVSAKVVAEVCRTVGVSIEARPLTLGDLRRADEIFITSTTFLLMPVVRLDDAPVGMLAPGSVTLQLAYHFQREFWAATDQG